MNDHPASTRTYYLVFVALLVLLAATVLAAEIEHRAANTLLSIGIAVAKALLIMIFFMHLKFAKSLIRVFAAAGFLWLGILFALLFSDYLSRG